MTQEQKLEKAVEMLMHLATCAWLPDSTIDDIYDLLEELED